MPANQCLSFLHSVYRRPCVDHQGLRYPVEQWLAGGGRYHRKRRKRISSPTEVLPLWRRGMEAAVGNPVHRDVFLFGLYTGMRRKEILALRWEDVDLDKGLFRVEETKTRVPLELPVTRQLGTILARRARPCPWSFAGGCSRPGRAHRGTWRSCRRTTGDRACGRREVLVPRVAERVHHGGGAGADAAAIIDEAAGEPRAAQ